MRSVLEWVETNTESRVQIYWSFKEKNAGKKLKVNVALVTSSFIGMFVSFFFLVSFLFFYFLNTLS